MKPEQKSVSDLRRQIDDLDRQILALISQRAGLAAEIGRLKNESGLPVINPARENEILERIETENPGPLSRQGVRSIFSSLIRECRGLQTPLSVAYLGPTVSFSHQAVVRKFGTQINLKPFRSIAEVFDEVESGRCRLGVVPVENSTEGIVTHTLDCFAESELSIQGEIILPIRLALLSRSPLSEITTLYSHPQALGQCRRWLASRLSNITVKETASTAEAAQKAAGKESVGAIGSPLAAELYGLDIIEDGIEDFHHNRTRFLLVGRDRPASTGQDRTSLLFSLKDQPGALYKALEPLAAAGLNLTKIESRPSKGKAWEYLFFIDVDGHRDDPVLAEALKAVSHYCQMFRILGSYPKEKENNRD